MDRLDVTTICLHRSVLSLSDRSISYDPVCTTNFTEKCETVEGDATPQRICKEINAQARAAIEEDGDTPEQRCQTVIELKVDTEVQRQCRVVPKKKCRLVYPEKPCENKAIKGWV